MPKILYTVAAANARLSATNTKVKIEERGQMLCLRATLPPKQGTGRAIAHQQRIRLGWPATEKGIKQAEASATLLRAKLTSGQFTWSDYMEGSDRNPLKVSEVVEKFGQQYRAQHKLQNRTWEKNWLTTFSQLPQTEPLSIEMIERLVRSKAEHTAARKHVCSRLQKLANFAGLTVDLSKYQGGYGQASVEAIDLPSDELIAEWRDRIPNENWQWVYGIMAAAGLRPHEAFFCEWSDAGLCVLKGKTGPRLVSELFYPEWVEQWNLKNIKRPATNAELGYTTGRLGREVAKALRRYGLPFRPYALRHAAAVRMTVGFEMPVTTSAALLGHSPDLHLKTYQKYIREDQVRKSVQRAMEKSDRPVAPII